MANSFEEALEELNSSDYNTQWSGASFLSKFDGEQAKEPLIEALLNHENDRVRVVAASGLEHHSGKQVIDTLIHALHHDKHIDVRHTAAYSLSAFPTDRVINILANSLETESANLNRMMIAISLGKIRNDRAIPVLIKALRTQDSQVTSGVAFALKEFGKLAQSELKKVYDENPEKVKEAFNGYWDFVQEFVMQPNPISEQLAVKTSSQEEKDKIRSYLPPISEWDCPVCGKSKENLTWYHIYPKDTQELIGSWAIVCDTCDIQVSQYAFRRD